jgi:hypothetical protein
MLMLTQPGGESGNNLGRVAGQSCQEAELPIDVAINYFKQTHEPRPGKLINDVINVIKSQYDWANHAMPWVSAAKGPWCSGTCTSDPVRSGTAACCNCLEQGGYAEPHGTAA